MILCSNQLHISRNSDIPDRKKGQYGDAYITCTNACIIRMRYVFWPKSRRQAIREGLHNVLPKAWFGSVSGWCALAREHGHKQ